MIEMSQDEGALWRMGFAGDTLNTAWYFRALTDPSSWQVSYFTRLGRDSFSDRMVAFLQDNGLDTSLIGRDEVRQPGLYFISLDNGERSFTYWRSQSAARRLADDAPALRDAVMGSDLVYASGITLAILNPEGRLALIDDMTAARAAGRTTVFDSNIRPRLWEDADTMRAVLMQAAETATIVLPSFDDERSHFGDASPEACASRYLNNGSDEVVVKNGGGTMCIADKSGQRAVAGLERVTPVDTTGAGDSFNAGYLAARAQGLAPQEAAAKAHALAMSVVQHRGALMPMSEIGNIG